MFRLLPLILLVLFSAPQRAPLHSTALAMTRPLSSYQWSLRQMRVPKAWSLDSREGAGVVVCDLDTGVSPTTDVPDTEILPGVNLIDPGHPDRYGDDHGHGSFVASEMVGNGTLLWGVAPKARVLPVKVLSAAGEGGDSVVDAGILACVARGADVINMSLGSTAAVYDGMADTIKIACDAGVVIAAAAGNDGHNAASSDPASIVSPCLIAVAATDKTGAVAGFSSVDVNPREVNAPGQNILGDAVNGGAAMASGTSMSAPEVAGILALLRGMGVPPREAVQIVLDTAIQQTGFQRNSSLATPCAHGYDITRGCGLVNAAAAVRAAKERGF